MDFGGVGILALGVLAVAAVVYANHRKKVRKRESLRRLLDRDPRLRLTTTPCGLDPEALPTFAGIERGDRRRGVRYGIEGPVPMQTGGEAAELSCAAFQWWWEERRTSHNQHGTQTSYTERRTTVAMVRLPFPVPDRLVLRPESVLGRVGLTRGGHQVESSEFNRRFRVECQDRTLSLRLLDAGMQELLLTAFAGRCVELRGDLLVLVGRPDHRDTSLEGVVGELPAVRQDAARLIGAIPPSFWRAIDRT